MKIFKQILKEFSVPLTLSVLWVFYNFYGKATLVTIKDIVNTFGPTFFLMSWMTGQFFRVKKQTNVEESLLSIESRLKESQGKAVETKKHFDLIKDAFDIKEHELKNKITELSNQIMQANSGNSSIVNEIQSLENQRLLNIMDSDNQLSMIFLHEIDQNLYSLLVSLERLKKQLPQETKNIPPISLTFADMKHYIEILHDLCDYYRGTGRTDMHEEAIKIENIEKIKGK